VIRLSKAQIRMLHRDLIASFGGPEYTQRELYETIIDVASGLLDYEGLLQWIIAHV